MLLISLPSNSGPEHGRAQRSNCELTGRTKRSAKTESPGGSDFRRNFRASCQPLLRFPNESETLAHLILFQGKPQRVECSGIAQRRPVDRFGESVTSDHANFGQRSPQQANRLHPGAPPTQGVAVHERRHSLPVCPRRRDDTQFVSDFNRPSKSTGNRLECKKIRLGRARHHDDVVSHCPA